MSFYDKYIEFVHIENNTYNFITYWISLKQYFQVESILITFSFQCFVELFVEKKSISFLYFLQSWVFISLIFLNGTS